MSWCTIESDPGVFNEMISSLGVKDVSVEEVYTLDDPSLLQDEAHGLIFLFKCQEESDPRPTIDASTVGDLFFARQTVQNACATQAILSVLLNSNSLELGNDLDEFKSFVLALDPESRGMAIGESDKIRTVHNSFARSEPFFIEESNRTRKGAKEDAFHFVAYVPFEGKVYELDGLRVGPIFLGEVGNSGNWLSVAKPAVESRMNRYAASETAFALLKLRKSKITTLQQEVDELLNTIQEMKENDPDGALASTIDEMENQRSCLESQLNDEKMELERQRQENIRRRHNYFPLILSLLKNLSKAGKLNGMIENAKAKAANSSATAAGGKK